MCGVDDFCPSMKLEDLNLHKELFRKYIIELINIHKIYSRN